MYSPNLEMRWDLAVKRGRLGILVGVHGTVIAIMQKPPWKFSFPSNEHPSERLMRETLRSFTGHNPTQNNSREIQTSTKSIQACASLQSTACLCHHSTHYVGWTPLCAKKSNVIAIIHILKKRSPSASFDGTGLRWPPIYHRRTTTC
jgi:hypothetical protein